MSLWTPGGEVPISRRPAEPEPARPESDEPEHAVLGGIDLDQLSPEEREQAEQILAEMAETQRRLAGMPAAEVVANHAMGLYELAAIHLSQATPQLDDAKIAIDAMQAMIDAVGRAFGPNERVLREALGNLQMAFVKLKDGSGPEGPG
jgi:hypothetical protein